MSPVTILIMLSVFYVIAGACNAGFCKYIVSQISLGLKFSHGWFLNLVMFIGESMGIPVFYLFFNKKEKEKEKSEENKIEGEMPDEQVKKPKKEEKPEINKFLLAIPGFTDTLSTGLANIGLILLPASIYQMLKGSLIILTFLMSKFVVRNKHILDHYIAIPLSTLGVVLVGLSAYLNAEDEKDENKSDATQTLLGIFLMVFAMLILSIQFCFDECFMRKYSCHPLICIGYEGVFGFFINLLLCIIFSFIECGNYPKDQKDIPYFVKNICTGDDKNVWRPENLIFAFRQLINNTFLIIIVPVAIFFMSTFNIFGVSITKYGSATTRSVTDNVRSFLVWLWFLMPFNNKELIESFSWLQLLGFLCICLGAFIYNGMFKLEERTILRKKRIHLEQVDETKLVESQRNTTNIEV